MPQIPPGLLEKFKQIYKEELGKELSDQEALGSAGRLLALVRIMGELHACDIGCETDNGTIEPPAGTASDACQ